MSQSLIGPIVFLKRDYAHFEKWLNLDYEALTWQGRFRNDFNQFWDIFFVEGLSLGQLIDRFHFCLHSCEAGPLSSWLKWLMNHLVVYSFLNKESSIKEISLQTGLSLSEVSLILRNGEIIEELIDEVQTEGYDVTIIGKSKNSKKDYELSQFIDSSIFIVNNNDFNQNYKILLPVDDSPGMKKAVKYSARIAQAFKIGIDLITVSKSNKIHQKNKQALTWAEKFLRRCNIDFKSTLEIGETVEAITRKAGANHIIIMGSSSSGALKTFIAGSKPLRVLKNSNSPI